MIYYAIQPFFLYPIFPFKEPYHTNCCNFAPCDFCRICHWIQTSDKEQGFLLVPFLSLAFPSAGGSLCLACRSVIAKRAKVTPVKSESSLCSLCHPVLSILAVAWLVHLLLFCSSVHSHANFFSFLFVQQCKIKHIYSNQQRDLIMHTYFPDRMLVSGSRVHI